MVRTEKGMMMIMMMMMIMIMFGTLAAILHDPCG